jgi:GMP synthase-like glutamine amidotransferase
MPLVTIIETGLVSPKNRELHGSYPQMFEQMIGAADANVTFDTVSIPAGEPLPDVEGLEAVLITGSSAGVYDGFEWIAPLEEFVRMAHQRKVPMVGVCFGHQLIAQALGGTARKSEKGWGLGRHVYDVAVGNGLIDGRHIALACSHQARSSRHRPAPRRSCLRISRRMPDCSTPAAPRSRCRHTRNSPSASRWPAARWCAARAMRPMAW